MVQCTLLKLITLIILLHTSVAHTSPIYYADGDLAPLGAPNNIVDISDFLIANRIASGEIPATQLQLSHGDLYPVGVPDGVIDLHDLYLLQQLINNGSRRYVENLTLFNDGPATITGQSGSSIASTTLVASSSSDPGAVVTDNPNFIDPNDASNTVWQFSASGGTASIYLSTIDLSSHPILNTGFDLSTQGSIASQGQLVFDLRVNSISTRTNLTVKIDSGYPNFGQVQLTRADYSVGSWRTVTIDVADFLANPGGSGLDLDNVVNPFVLEVSNGSADLLVDNIFYRHACAGVNGCSAAIKTKVSPLVDNGSSTSDLTSGLEWLDLTLTQGVSAQSILAGFGGYIADGWAFATAEQVCSLLGALGDSTTSCTSGATGQLDPSNAVTLANLLGSTATVGLGAYGMYANVSEFPNTFGLSCINDTATSCTGEGNHSWLTLNSWGSVDQTVGSFLVKSITPIDSDNDGVIDSLDQCPATPTGELVDATGCTIIISQLSASATASSTGAAGGASFAVDGNMASRWGSSHNIDPSSITLDLGASHSLSEVIIHWEAANAATYQIQGSADNSNWTSLSNESGGAFGDRTDNVSVSGTYRYVRMNGLTRSNGNMWGYSIWEMEVYGTPAADTDGDGVSDDFDQCPGTPAGSNVDSAGCIIVDTDGDGIPDSSDLCPSTPAGGVVGGTGCSVIIPVNEVTSINDILAGGSGASQPGFTLYIFDNDPLGTSTCYDGCATNWPPLLAGDGIASGVSDLGTITRNDGTIQVTHNGRPLYFYIGDAILGDTNGDGAGGVWHTIAYVQTYNPLFDNATVLQPDTQFETSNALVTRWSDRPRTRHSREDQFQSYDHYIKFYFEDRSSNIEIVDYVAKGGDTIEMNVRTIFPLNNTEAENRWWFASPSATYFHNTIMNYQGFDGTYYHYQKTSTFNPRENRAIQVGDRLEFEVSQFSAPGIPRGQINYYGTVFLYIVGEGIVPWYAKTGNEDSEKIPEEYWLGGHTSTHYQYSDEPNDHFLQMATNLGYDNGQTFLLGRRVHHSSVIDGMHDEDPDNGVLTSNVGLSGTKYINERCNDCHERNGSAPVAFNGQLLDRWVFKIGDANGAPDPNFGSVLQPKGSAGEGDVSIASWTELSNGLRTPNYQFSGDRPDRFSARIAPRLVGLGLLEAIVESDIEALADPADSNGDGISGRVNLVTDAVSGENRVGRFGWKAAQPTVKQQTAAALNTDMGVRTSVMPNPDCGSAQTNCGENSPMMPDENLDNLVLYIATLGVRPQRVWKAGVEDQDVLQGRDLFRNIGCVGCHTETFQTSQFHPLAEVRDQTIHPYSDMLLHDMGTGLADTLSEGMASGGEWRTTPLWGLGLAACVTGGVTNPSGNEGGEFCAPHHAYLHDGRARSIEEAILWHGGDDSEGKASTDAYNALSAQDQQLLLRFLESL